MLRLVKGTTEPNKYDLTAMKSNKYDSTAAPYFLQANHNDWCRWFAISSLPPICSPSLILWVSLEKSIKLNLDVRNILLGQILSTAGVALTQTPYVLI